MKKTQLSKAIAFALTGAALSMGAVTEASAASTTMYNLYRANFAGYGPGGQPNVNPAIYTATSTTPCAPCDTYFSTPYGGADNGTGNDTDGFVWDANPNGYFDDPNNPNADPLKQPVEYGHKAANADPNRPGWVGIGGSSTPALSTPFGYSSSGTLNWAMELQGGGSGEISNADAISRYSQSANIDTARGAWSNAANARDMGWKYDLDWGLIKSDATGLITLSITGVNETANYGFTIFQGMSPNANGFYTHHGAWNDNVNRNPSTGAEQLSTRSIPGLTGFTIADIVAYSVGDNPLTAENDPLRLNTITFNAVAGQVYTVALGGYQNGGQYDSTDGYKLTISQASPVPVPAAAWLFGGAIASLIGANRRKRVMPA
ncbi:hypothetical protein A1359_10110 [Methylomonas lenta]|uniref:Uncharacterized protein n=1 Tax=Methylomonas lenta TaxID=980561 RepID=A0A177NB09_9GAMM|nr:VPLPA-CTERM sorting domain-containing protein [Methylomonas lenta]OAI15055.1 hypothetical protein A1359_10110 [Methylomonas lenta]